MRHYVRTALAVVLALQSALTGLTPATIRIAHATTSDTVHLRVVARPPGTAIHDPLPAIPHYKFIINEDNTGNPFQARSPGCSAATDPLYPANCTWPSIRTVTGSSKIVTQGDETVLNEVRGLEMLPGKYLISVTADGFKIDGAHFSIPMVSPGPLTVGMLPYSLPLAIVKLQVFSDDNVVNGQYDVPGEQGIGGFEGHLFDVLGEVTTDWFGNPLCTSYVLDSAGKILLDAGGKPTPIVGTGGKCVSQPDGELTIPNVGPNRYTATVVPPTGSDWVQTTTLEGNHDFDVWVQEGATGFSTEQIGLGGEPVPAIPFGYVRPKVFPTTNGASGHIRGVGVGIKGYVPPVGGLPNNPEVTGFAGVKTDKPIDRPWIALNDLRLGDTTVFVGRGNPDGTFDIPNVPNGDYALAIWDQNQDYLLDMHNVTVANGQTTDMGPLFLAGWWTTFEGYVFVDSNGNGVKDPTERGIAGIDVTLKTRVNSIMDRGSTSVKTDLSGHYVLREAYPLSAWVVMEVYNDRFYTTGVTYQADNQPTPTTVLGSGVDVSVHPIIGLSGHIDWGVKPYSPGTNGGIVGTVTYDSTRNELDPRFAFTEAYQPGIPGLQVNLYSTVKDPAGQFVKDPDGAYKRGPLLNTYITETWERPTNCIARDVNGTPFWSPALAVATGDHECVESPMLGVQFQTGFSTVNGNYGFATTLHDLATGAGIPEAPLPSGDYLVEVLIPPDAYGRPLYQVTKEEDVNVFNGDQFQPQVPPPPCAGPLHTVTVTNPALLALGGSPFEGQQRPLCTMKMITVQNGKSIAPNFNLFTDVPLPVLFAGVIVDDLNLSFNPSDILFGEKRGLANNPIGVYNYADQLVTTIVSDPNGQFEVLLPSTSSYNCPLPAGPCPSVYRFVGNDPGQPGALNPTWDPAYRTIAASFEAWPGLIIPADLAPTPVADSILSPGSNVARPASCALEPTTPQLFAVSRPYVLYNTPTDTRQITLTGLGFGNTAGQLTLTVQDGPIALPNPLPPTPGIPLTINSWSDRQIVATVPAVVPPNMYQLTIKAASRAESVNGITLHILGTAGFGPLSVTYNPTLAEVGPGKQYAKVQAALEAVASRPQALVVVYPGATAQFNPLGAYYENVVVHSPLKLQGVGSGGVYPDGSHVRGSVLDGTGFEQVNAPAWLDLVSTLTFSGNQNIYEGQVVYVVARDGQNVASFKPAIDGFTIQGGDQMGFPTNINQVHGGHLPPGTPGAEAGAVVSQGGGIFVNGYARYLRITNNVLRSNSGTYGGAIRVGTPYVGDSHNDNIRIANNQIVSNGGSNLAGAIGLFAGTTNYEVTENDICGNSSTEYGGAISHFGLSPNGTIHHNRMYFNRSFDEGGAIMIAGELPVNPATSLSTGSGAVNVFSNIIQSNLANDDGGGIRLLMAGNFPINIYNNMIVNNVSTHEGGGIALDDATSVRIYNNTIMKNLTTATAATSNGQPAPAGISSTGNSALLQASLPPGSPTFSNPVLFNNILWDNRAGRWDAVTKSIRGIGLSGDPGAINYWDLGTADSTGVLGPTNSILRTDTGTVLDPSNKIGVDPQVLQTYDTSVSVLPWRTDPNFINAILVAVDLPPTRMGDYHIKTTSPAVNAGAASKAGVNAPADDLDRDVRPRSTANPVDIGADELGPLGPIQEVLPGTGLY